ncbi:MAG: zinc ABC transporter substrate-binding protein [Thermodesulfobacteriota bacterium]|nr:zinc ABC transporter substrate-binding protein [Thermodesulfobacteriota bacterium]
MMTHKSKKCFGIIYMVMYLWGILCLAEVSAGEKLSVFVSIMPQKYFVEKIGGTLVDVSVMVKPGASPATYEPKPHQMAALSKTTIYFFIGVPFERVWLEKIKAANSAMLMVHTEESIEKRPMRSNHHHHSEKNSDKHNHVVKDPHIWLSPPLVMIQARNIFTALAKADPAHRLEYQSHYQVFIEEVVHLDNKIMEIFADTKKEIEFMVFHPAWGYFAQAYGLQQLPVEIEGKEPKPFELEHLIRYAQERGIGVVFVQPQFSTKSAQTIAHAIGGKVVIADPLAYNWADNLHNVAIKFNAALK